MDIQILFCCLKLANIRKIGCYTNTNPIEIDDSIKHSL